MGNKTAQLQIRVSDTEKALIKEYATANGMSVSSWVIGQLLDRKRVQFGALVSGFDQQETSHLLAELHDLLAHVSITEFERMVEQPPKLPPSSYLRNYIAAMIECAALRLNAVSPSWVKRVQPLEKPIFGTGLVSLRLYLLTNTPLPFRRRNIFVDSTIGDRI